MIISNKLESMDSLSKSEEILAKFILREKENIESLSTKDLAKATYTSPSTAVRLSKKLGFSGWNELKEKYLEELHYLNQHFSNIDPNYPFDTNDTFINVAAKIGHLASESIEDTLSLLKHTELQKAVELLHKSQHISIYGISNSLIMAYDFKHKMLRINKYVDIMNVPEEQPFVASNSTPQHVAILISYSGETEGVLKIANLLKRNRTPIISLTSIGENSLRKLSDCALSISTREKLYSKIATYSTNNSIHLILDILYSCLFKMDYDRNLEYKTNVSKNVDERVSSSTLLKEE
ncbi:MurR/RpiR family transcriptional regulator [Priestia endophytica]|uniref:Transcriptional regulator, RpiR family protein n=1 Tax=Priestia endophytica TaxID=135735 RepID=A0AAX1QC33_9BACI|nr:MurR/RpiR family transcriptional regulator [Priestia endophytica]RAS76926.1 transcriptional regulator, RpiR family protein [Priestia endophytica]RAS88140.1 transcriptional regulator, RpiR family protein [Priestia endophytica]